MIFNSEALLLGFGIWPRALCFASFTDPLIVSLASAQYEGGRYNPSSNPYGGGGNSGNNGDGIFGFDMESYLSIRRKMLIAHGVLAALVFVVFFPMGSILIRLGSFRGLWLIHGLFQLFAYMVYTAAFGCGVWMANNIPIKLIDHYHPVIGIVVFCLLFFQPILGLIHHFQFKKYSRRTIWSHGHLWLGRIIVTLGMINGGLGMLLATETGFFVPSRAAMTAYGVAAATTWLAWVGAAILGEYKRGNARRNAEVGGRKEQYA